MWKTIEGFGIKRETFTISNPMDKEIWELYQLIRKRMRDKRDLETIKRLQEYIEKLKKRGKS
jgi:hypothetical protein